MHSAALIETYPKLWVNICAVTLALLVLCAPVASAQDPAAADAQPEAAAQPKPLPDSDIQALQEQLDTIQANGEEVALLEVQVKETSGLEQQVLETRLDRLWLQTLNQAMVFGRDVVGKQDAGFDVGKFADDVRALLDRIPNAVRKAVERISTRVPDPDMTASAADQAIADQRFFVALANVADTFKSLLEGIKLAKKIGLDPSDEEAFLRNRLANATSNLSVYLAITKTQAAGLRTGAALLPDDKELAARLKLADIRVRRIGEAMQTNLSMMADLGLSTTQYKQQLLAETGEITTSVFEWDVLTGLLASWRQAAMEFLIKEGPSFALNLLVFCLIIYVFMKLGSGVQRLIRTGFQKSRSHFSVLLQDMVLSTSRNIVLLVGILIALSQLGISLGPLLAGLGIAGFIVGFALQDSLSNFASGMMILFYRPFDVGDTIEAAGARGKVSHMSLVNTTIRTFDNQSLIIPNNKIWQDVITNVTDQTMRRVDMTFGITYDEDIDKVEKVMLDVMANDERVLEDPEPVVKVGSFGDSSVNILCRPWVKTEDYWDVLWDLNKKIKQAFDKEGITIPFPQRDLHIYDEGSASKPKDADA